MKKWKPASKRLGLLLAIAAASSGATAADKQLILEEIIVTSQKREQSLQQVPIAISAFGADQLEAFNITALDDMDGLVPSFRTPPFAASIATPTVFIRGMGNVGVQTTRDGAVGVYLDGVTLGRATGLALDVADLERIEILRGPQGTLYGRNTSAGAINYITRKPHEELAFKQRVTLGNYDHWVSQTDLNVPITDKLFIKAGYMRSNTDGWVENQNQVLPNQIDPYEKDSQAATVALRWLATEDLTVDYTYDKSELDYGNGWYQTVIVPSFNLGTATTGDERKDKAPLAKGMEESNVEAEGHNLTLSWDIGDVTLKSITSYRELESNLWQNYTDGVFTDFGFFIVSEFVQTWPLEQDQFSQEFQAIGTALNGALEYVVGLYYYEEDATESKINDFGVPGFPFLESYTVDAEAESTAVYGQAAWTPDILDQRLGFTLGLRYTEDERKAAKAFVNTAISGPAAPVNGDLSFDDTSGQFVIDYAFNDDVNGYLKYATGYRSGGFNNDGRPGNFELGFDSEKVKSTELGLKSTLWDQRITLNFAAYYNEYTDLQVDAFEPPVFSRTDNAGEASIQGAELEWKILLAQGFTIDGFYSYMDPDIKEWVVPGLGDVSDQQRLPNAPENQAKLGVEYAFQEASYGQLTARVDYMWQDESWSNPDQVNLNDEYGLWNARLQLSGVSLPKGDLRIALWGKNLSDEEYTTITTDFSGFGAVVSAMYGQPRTYGVDFIYEF